MYAKREKRLLVKKLQENGMKSVTKDNLIDWFCSSFDNGASEITVYELMLIAREIGIEVIR